jgi:hypothetical protein
MDTTTESRVLDGRQTASLAILLLFAAIYPGIQNDTGVAAATFCPGP